MPNVGQNLTMWYKLFSSIEKEVLKLASITIRIPDEEKKCLEQLAQKDDVTVSGIVRRAIRDLLAKVQERSK